VVLNLCVGQTLGTTENGLPKKTRIVLHVGPPKTGSTTVQLELYTHQSSLRLDGWTFVNASQFGKTRPRRNHQIRNVAACYRKPGEKVHDLDYSEMSCTKWHEFLALLTVQPNGRLVMSSESFSHVYGDDMSQLASDLAPFTTRIVMVYRPFYDWVASVYRQNVHGTSFEAWLTDEIMEYNVNSFTTSVYKRYASAFADVKVHTLGPSLMADIACDDLEARTTCAYFQRSAPKPHNVKAATSGRECLSAYQLQKLQNISFELHMEAFGFFSSFPKSDFDTKASICFGNE